MNALAPVEMTPKPTEITPTGGRVRRPSPRVLHALKLRVEKGMTGEEAAKVAGLSPAGFWKAWVQPHTQQAYHDMKIAYIARVMDRKEVLKARALEVAEELLAADQPANVRARMVEFLAGETRQAPVNQVNISIPQDRSGYVFSPPKDVTPDAVSPVTIEQPADNTGE